MSGYLSTTCQTCGRPARARLLQTGPGAWLHVSKVGHAVVPLEVDERRRRALMHSLDNVTPWMENVPVKDGLL